jgi:hypothetical protein
VVYGKASGGTTFRRRTSAGSIPISAANRSTARSIAAAASGRPAPRYAEIGVVLVAAARNCAPARGRSYTPLAISMVSEARNGPIREYPPQSWTISRW